MKKEEKGRQGKTFCPILNKSDLADCIDEILVRAIGPDEKLAMLRELESEGAGFSQAAKTVLREQIQSLEALAREEN